MSQVNEQVTLLQAVAELYNFHPRSHKLRMLFEIKFKDTNHTIKFGKGWSKLNKDWQYFYGQTNCPTFGAVEKHFLSNLFCCQFGGKQFPLIYGAQQGDFIITRIE